MVCVILSGVSTGREMSQISTSYMKSIITKLVLSVIVLFCAQQSAKAQAALLALIFGDKVASEKFHLSVDLGMNFSSMPGLQQQSRSHDFYFGLGTFIKINEKWALTPEFKPISPRGAKNVLPLRDYSSVLSGITYDIELNYIDVPVLAQYRVTPTFFISAGPQISFLTSAKQVSEGTLPAGNSVDITEKMRSNFESLYFSVPLEVGYSFAKAHKGKGMDVKLRYNIGMSEMIAKSGYGSTRGSTFQVFLSFPFVKPAEGSSVKP